MGVSARDYMRAGAAGPNDAVRPRATWGLLLAVAFASLLRGQGRADEVGGFLARWLALDPGAVFERGRIWQLLTAPCFVPSGQWLAGVAALWLFVQIGRPVERHLGTLRFLLLVGVAAIASSVGALGAGRFEAAAVLWPGPIGAIFGVCVFAACIAPDRPVVLPLGAVWRLSRALLLAAVGIELLVATAPQAFATALAILGHLSGGVGGALMFLALGPHPYPRPRKDSAAARAPLTPPAVREQVDALLDRIGDAGLDSLSPEERAFLASASKHYPSREPPA